MNRRRLLGLLPALAAAPARAAQPAARTLRLGLIPYQTPAGVLRTFQPLREHLQDALQVPVQLYTAADFRALAEGARDGSYDLATLPAHLARVAAQDWNHRILARTAGAPTPLLLLARREQKPRGELRAALHGAVITTIDPLSVTALTLDRWLLEQKLQPDRDVIVTHARSIASALFALERREAHFVAMARSHLLQAAPEQQAAVDVVVTYGHSPRLMWTAHPGLDDAHQAALRAALLAFRNPLEAGRDGPAGGMEPASLADTDSAEALAVEARRALRAAR